MFLARGVGLNQRKYNSCELWGCHLLWTDQSRSPLHLPGSCKLLSDIQTGFPTCCTYVLCRLAKTRMSERVLQREHKAWNKQRIENDGKKNWTWSTFFEVKVIRMEQAGIYRLHRLWEGLQKQRGDRWTCFFSPAVTKMQHGFRTLRTTGRKGKQKVLILVSASHPCCSLISLRLGHSPGTHLQQSTRLINTDKFSVNTHDTEIRTTRAIFKL